jgi:hypothetical protein
MTYSFKTAGWPERLWRTNNDADIARGNVPGSTPFSTFGEKVVSGSGTSIVWQTGMPNTLTVPDNIQITLVSTSASDTGEIVLRYLDGNLIERYETVTLDGTTPVTTSATDIRALNNAYTKFGPVVGTVTMTSGGITYGRMTTGDIQFHTSMIRVPANKRLMLTGIYAGSASGSSASRVIVSLVTSFINGDSFAEDGYLHPLAAVSIQDGSATFPNFGPFPIPGGEWVGFRAKWDKATDITAGLFGWMENA